MFHFIPNLLSSVPGHG